MTCPYEMISTGVMAVGRIKGINAYRAAFHVADLTSSGTADTTNRPTWLMITQNLSQGTNNSNLELRIID